MTSHALSVAAFNHWRFDRSAAMTLVELCHGGALYCYDSPYSCTIWVFVSDDALLISYFFKGDSPEGVRAEVKRLLDALRGDPGALKQGLYPGLAARYRASEDTMEVACFNPGDWCGLFRLDLPARWDQLPPGWPERERARIEQLVDERVKMAQASSAPDEIHPIGRALAELKMYARAEVVFRRILALEEKAGNPTREASALQSLGALAAHQRRYDDAAALLGKAVQRWIDACGASDPRVASARDTLERVKQRAKGML